MRILLVDDDAFLRDMYATKFSEDGHEVQVAKSGEDALEILRTSEFDVLLLDVVMPGISGVELLTEIKKGKLGGDPVCLVLSNQGEDEDIESAKKAGAAGYIVKAELIPSEVIAEVKKFVS